MWQYSTPQPIVTIAITSSSDPLVKQKFNIHKNILCYYSRYFTAELNDGNPSLEGNPELITLTDVQTSTFGLFLNWIYYQKIRDEEGELPGLIDLAKLWAFGQRFEITALQNTTMDHIRDEVQYPTEFESFIHFAYEMEGDGNELRRLAIARLAWTLPDSFKEILRGLPCQAQMDLILELKSQRDAVPIEHWRDIGHAEDFYVVEKEVSNEEAGR
jgi:hypothetical protein